MRAALELAIVPRRGEHAHAGDRQRAPVRIGRGPGRCTVKTLARDRVAILEAGVADRHRRDAGRFGETARDPFGIRVAFLDVRNACSPAPVGSKPSSRRRGNRRVRRAASRAPAVRRARTAAREHRFHQSGSSSSRPHQRIEIRIVAADRPRIARAALQQHDRERGDAFAASGEAELLAGRRLDADVSRRGQPRSVARLRRIASTCGAIFGLSQTIVMSALAERVAALDRSAPAQCSRKWRLPTSFQRGSLGGK